EHKLLAGMAANDLPEAFARRIIAQIQGFGEYGFPESHAASFALLVYASAWLKRHHPAAFLCGLLNSQPMGFYSPSMLIHDARRHGVVVLPPDVTVSDWESRLNESGAVRLGLRTISGFSRAVAERIAAARDDCRAGAVDRQEQPFSSVSELAARAALQRRDLDLLAAADALASLAGHRRQAAWAATAAVAQGDLFDGLPPAEAMIELPSPGEAENLVADYRHLQLSLRNHPLSLLRGHLAARRFVTASELKGVGHRALIRAAGIVVGRQRPGTATGIVFVTLEDETGLANIVVHPQLVHRQRRELLGARLLGVFGQLQVEGEVVHLVAKRLVDLSAWLGRLATSSRDFH
ncbi:MAG: error-prone DNA polymerase, partial [Betaproteobacteria bacterium]